jgi:hypothetical protein
MSVSFGDWVNNGWLVVRKSSKQEFGNLLGIVARDLKDTALFSRWNSTWEKTRSSFAPLTHSAGRET